MKELFALVLLGLSLFMASFSVSAGILAAMSIF